MKLLGRRGFSFGLGSIIASHAAGCAAPARPIAAPLPPSPGVDHEHPPTAPASEAAPAPETEALVEAAPAPPAEPTTLELPPRDKNAETGSAFLKRVEGLGRAAMDDQVFAAIKSGNVPSYIRKLSRLDLVTEEGMKISLWVTCDYLALGSDTDFIRMPMTPAAAQKIADLTDTTLPTKKLVDIIYTHAEAKLPPSYIDGGPTEGTYEDYLVHHEKLEAKRKAKNIPLGVLTAGDKKDIVLSTRLVEHPNSVAIYGWHTSDTECIQPLSTRHSRRYADYSHGVRLIAEQMEIDGKRHRVSDVLADRELASLLSDEGPLSITSYPTTLPEYAATVNASTKTKKRKKKTKTRA